MAGSTAQAIPPAPAARPPAARPQVGPPRGFLDEWARAQLVFFGGKGGVGKTTLAAAAALAIARRTVSDGRRVLILSVDPAHSLADSLGQTVGAEAVPVRGADGLWAMELDAAARADAFAEENAEFVRTLLDRGTLLDRHDIDSFFRLTLPGMDEVMAVVEIRSLLEEAEWDLVLVDTAPTGHALRFLAMPGEMKRWLKALDVMQRKFRYIRRHFGGSGHPPLDAAEQFLADFNGKVERAAQMFAARDRAEFVPVTIAEPMAFAETERLLGELAHLGIHVKRLIVNQLIEPGKCAFCAARSRRQSSMLAAAPALAHLDMLPVPSFAGEVHGRRDLGRMADVLERLSAEAVTFHEPALRVPKREKRPRRVSREPGEPLVLTEGVRFTFFAGKGGVGKTSLAAATGLRLAGAHPDKRVLVFSADPAHSLADCLGSPVGPEIVPVAAANLFACEQDPEAMFERFRQRYGDSITDIFDNLTSSGVQVRFEKESMQQFASLSPPGVDEIMFLKSVMDLADGGQYDLFVFDMAPTGHALRFLELPELAHAWLRAIFKILLKYGHTAGEEMVDLARGLRRFQAILTDPAQAESVVVTLAEKMAVRESQRLIQRLSELGVGVHSVVFNKMIPRNRCAFCRRTRKVQGRHRAGFRKAHPGLRVVSVPLLPQPIAGLDALRDVESILFDVGRKG